MLEQTELMKIVSETVVVYGMPVPRRIERMGGMQYLWEFDNGLSASLILTPFSYGRELAMVRNKQVVYSKRIPDVIARVRDAKDLVKYLKYIRRLKPNSKAIWKRPFNWED